MNISNTLLSSYYCIIFFFHLEREREKKTEKEGIIECNYLNFLKFTFCFQNASQVRSYAFVF